MGSRPNISKELCEVYIEKTNSSATVTKIPFIVRIIAPTFGSSIGFVFWHWSTAIFVVRFVMIMNESSRLAFNISSLGNRSWRDGRWQTASTFTQAIHNLYL